jgi:hypothetical protein
MSITFIMNMTLLSPYVTLDANYANPLSSRKLINNLHIYNKENVIFHV